MHSNFRSVLLALALSSVVSIASAAPVAGPTPARALRLVLETQAMEIATIDEAHGVNQHDIKRHEWSVKRPAHPGMMDTTHIYYVTYSIDGAEAETWFVDLRQNIADADCEDETPCVIR